MTEESFDEALNACILKCEIPDAYKEETKNNRNELFKIYDSVREKGLSKTIRYYLSASIADFVDKIGRSVYQSGILPWWKENSRVERIQTGAETLVSKINKPKN
jgi:hypothetical protein